MLVKEAAARLAHEEPNGIANYFVCRELFRRLAPGAIVHVVDRSGYKKTDRMMQAMHAIAAESENIVSIRGEGPQQRSIDCSKTLKDVPDIVTNNLFHRWGDSKPNDWAIDGLIFAKKIDYVSMAFQVR